MTRPPALRAITRLWHPDAGWRTFQKGEPDPGDAWSDVEGGRPEPAGGPQMQADLAQAHAEVEALARVLAARDFDIAMIGKARDDAEAQAEALRQRTLDAERAASDALQAARELSEERDRLTQAVSRLQAQVAGLPSAAATAVPYAPNIRIPDNWETLPFLAVRALANKVSPAPVSTKPEVFAAIRNHLAETA